MYSSVVIFVNVKSRLDQNVSKSIATIWSYGFMVLLFNLWARINDLRESSGRCFVCSVHPIPDAVRGLVRRIPFHYAGQDITRWVLVMARESVALFDQFRSVTN